MFLLYSAGKSSLSLCFAVLLLTSLTGLVRSFWLRAVLLLTPLVLLNLLSVGTTMSDTLAEIAKLLPLDSSFTGRIDIWTFALQSLKERLATGYGFAAFWGSSAIQNLPEGKEWAGYAAHSHNGYLDTALGMGLPGLVLLIAALVIKPLRDFQAVDEGGNNGPLAMALLRIWLFGLYLSSMESFFLDRSDPPVVHLPAGAVRTALSGALSRNTVSPVERRDAGLMLRRSYDGSSALIARTVSCHQPSKSNGGCAAGRFRACAMRSA